MIPPEMVQMMLGEYLASEENRESFRNAVTNALANRGIVYVEVQYIDNESNPGFWELQQDDVGSALISILAHELNIDIATFKPPYVP